MTFKVTEENFLKDVANHKIFILRDDGIYRHVAFKKPGTTDQRFDMITWPGYLCYTGDMGTYVFQRTADMFTFFRNPPADKAVLPINTGYWSEKLEAVDRCDGLYKFSLEKFREAIKEQLENSEVSAEFREAVESDLLKEDFSHEYEARQAIHDFEFEGYEDFFADFWEVSIREYTGRFIWACYAIVWGIQQYDKAQVPGRISFSQGEIEAMRTSPSALRAVADWHETQLTKGDAMGFDCSRNAERKRELLETADKIEAAY